MDSYQQVIHQSRYSRWIESENRRETWEETVDRYMSTWSDLLMNRHPKVYARRS